MRKFDSVAHGIDIGGGGAQEGVDANAALTKFETGRGSQLCFGAYADGEEHQVGREARAVVEVHTEAVVGAVEMRHTLLQIQFHALLEEFTVDKRGHREVQRCHHLIGGFDHGDVQPGLVEIFGHFQSDESAAHDDGGRNVGAIDIGLDAVGVLDRAERENALVFNTGQRRAHR